MLSSFCLFYFLFIYLIGLYLLDMLASSLVWSTIQFIKSNVVNSNNFLSSIYFSHYGYRGLKCPCKCYLNQKLFIHFPYMIHGFPHLSNNDYYSYFTALFSLTFNFIISIKCNKVEFIYLQLYSTLIYPCLYCFYIFI